MQSIKPRRTITWDELTKAPRIESWQQGIYEGKKLYQDLKKNRIAIAQVAIRSCIVKHGGDQRSDYYQKHLHEKSLMMWADKVGIHYKTLMNWVYVVIKILDNLEPHERKGTFNFTKLNRAMRPNAYGDEGDKVLSPVERYRKELKKGPNEDKVYSLHHYLKYCRTLLHDENVRKAMTKEQKQGIKKVIRSLTGWL